MKLSLAWLFDHIDADWQKIDVAALVNRFNKTVAEIEGFEKVSIDVRNLALATVQKVSGQTVTVHAPEWKQTIDLPIREISKDDSSYLIAREGDLYRWATMKDLGSEKDTLLPPFTCEASQMAGGWKKQIEAEDYILHLDNKSINHRPDMWGHRGVAREVAALLDLPFRALDHLLIAKDVAKKSDFSVTVENPAVCRRFAGLYFPQVGEHRANLWMAARLARVDSRPINAIVDATNYVMLDLSQPLHAFDVDALAAHTIVVRNAKNKETITLLDGQNVELTDQDCVITDGKKPIALAGIMGGKDSGVTCKTKSIFVESANFDPAAIRKTSARIKKRSESSARFEKNLDLAQNSVGLERFLKLLDDAGIVYPSSLEATPDFRTANGYSPLSRPLEISHAYIEKLLGITIAPAFIKKTLQKLEFGVAEKNGSYTITIPSFRATKDIAIKQDIVEEIGRFYGYDAIAEQLPSRQTKPFDIAAIMRLRKIKQLLAFGFDMRELYTYAFFDESFLNTLGWQPGPTLKVQEAVSENWQRLATSLVPNILKMVHTHAQEFECNNFFEYAKIWPAGTAQSEHASLAGIFAHHKKPIDFYEGKNRINSLFHALGISVEWVKLENPELSRRAALVAPWYIPHETAQLIYQGKSVGVAGMANASLYQKIALGTAFIFEIDGNFLTTVRSPQVRYTAPSKYPSITRDISFLIPVGITAASLQKEVAQLDGHITQVSLVDFFQKPEWQDQKSVTLRLVLQDVRATMASATADQIMSTVSQYLTKQGGTVR